MGYGGATGSGGSRGEQGETRGEWRRLQWFSQNREMLASCYHPDMLSSCPHHYQLPDTHQGGPHPVLILSIAKHGHDFSDTVIGEAKGTGSPTIKAQQQFLSSKVEGKG